MKSSVVGSIQSALVLLSLTLGYSAPAGAEPKVEGSSVPYYFKWTFDGKSLYSAEKSSVDDTYEIRRIGRDGQKLPSWKGRLPKGTLKGEGRFPYATLSPDGKFLAFWRPSATDGDSIFLLDLKTGKVATLGKQSPPGTFQDHEATWLPDGNAVVYALNGKAWSYSPTTKKAKQLCSGIFDSGVMEVRVSSAGNLLAINKDIKISITNIECRNAGATLSRPATGPVFSPSGQLIAAAVYNAARDQMELLVMNSDGSERAQINPGVRASDDPEDGPAWLSDDVLIFGASDALFSYTFSAAKRASLPHPDAKVAIYDAAPRGGGVILKQGDRTATSLLAMDVAPPKYDRVDPIKEGLVRVFKDKYGFIDSSGAVIVPVQYDYAANFSEGLAFVTRGTKSGFIDKTGTNVIPLEFDDGRSFQEGLCALKKNGQWGFIDAKGNIAIAFKYQEANSFSKGLAVVKQDGDTFKIDKAAKRQP